MVALASEEGPSSSSAALLQQPYVFTQRLVANLPDNMQKAVKAMTLQVRRRIASPRAWRAHSPLAALPPLLSSSTARATRSPDRWLARVAGPPGAAAQG